MEDNRQSHDEIDLRKVLLLLWRKRKLNMAIVAVFVASGIVYAFLIATPLYRSSITLYPANQEESGNSQLRMMASQFGIGELGGLSSNYNIPDVAKSRRIAKRILDNKWTTIKNPDEPIDLISFWEIESVDERSVQEAAIRRIQKRIVVSTNEETGLITIGVLLEEPQLAADIVNCVGESVVGYIQEEQSRQSIQNTEFITERSAVVQNELATAEEALRVFLVKNRNYQESPTLSLEMGRLQQQVLIKREVFIALAKQRELALIDGVKKTPVINMLDSGERAVRQDRPNRKVIVLSAFIAATVLGVLLSLLTGNLSEMYYRKPRSGPADVGE